MTTTRSIIEAHWDAANRRDWKAFQALLHADLRYEVPQTREYVAGAPGYLDLFVTWPGDWQADVRSIVCEGDRATSVIGFRTVDGEATGITLFRVEDGRIREVTDYWPEPYEPPPRRSGYVKRHDAPVPQRPLPKARIEASRVSLREVTAETVRPVVRLAVAKHQEGFVASNAISLAQALFAPEAWYRAIYLDERPVGFVMVYDETLRAAPPDEPIAFVWRFMVDEHHQGRGIGEAAMKLVIEHVRAKGRFRKLELSYVPGPGGPDGMYRKLGFVDTGRVDEGERVMELPL
jgi:diamine N-acetyltransferase